MSQTGEDSIFASCCFCQVISNTISIGLFCFIISYISILCHIVQVYVAMCLTPELLKKYGPSAFSDPENLPEGVELLCLSSEVSEERRLRFRQDLLIKFSNDIVQVVYCTGTVPNCTGTYCTGT